VPQTVVNFCNHRLVFLTDNEQDTRRELMKRGFDYLIEVALQGLAATRVQKQQLEQQQRQLLFQKKARLLQTARPGLEVLLEPATSELTEVDAIIDVDAIEQQLQDVEAELDQLRADSATLEQHLANIATTLGQPENYLRLEQVSLTLDQMNTKVPPHSSRLANTLTFDEMVLAEDRRVTALFIRFPSHELLPQPDFFKEARRFL
jgi:cell division protein FtsB